MVIKRSMNPGFAGIDNPLYYLDNNLMLFGDAKAFVGSIVRELGGARLEVNGVSAEIWRASVCARNPRSIRPAQKSKLLS